MRDPPPATAFTAPARKAAPPSPAISAGPRERSPGPAAGGWFDEEEEHAEVPGRGRITPTVGGLPPKRARRAGPPAARAGRRARGVGPRGDARGRRVRRRGRVLRRQRRRGRGGGAAGRPPARGPDVP